MLTSPLSNNRLFQASSKEHTFNHLFIEKTVIEMSTIYLISWLPTRTTSSPALRKYTDK